MEALAQPQDSKEEQTMKRKVLLSALIMSLMASSAVFASTDNSLSDSKKTLANTVFTGINAPKLVIKPNSGTAGGDAVFKLHLSNAEWKYDDSGSIEAGVEYTLLGDSDMVVTVDGTQFDLSTSTLMIPLNVEVIEEDNAFVTVEPMSSTVSAGTYQFAHTVYPQTEITVSDCDKESGKFTITAEDDYGYIFYARKCFKLTLPKGFEFEGYEKAVGEGKYNGKVDFSIDSKAPNVAYISTTADTSGGEGEMIVEGIKVKALPTALYGTVQLSVETAYGESDTLKFNLFEYEKAEEEKNYADEKTKVVFKIGKKSYYVGREVIKMDASARVDENGRVIVPARYLANALGVNDTNIQWFADENGGRAVIIKNGKTIEARPGEKFLTVNGEKIAMDTSAVIIEDRIYLPLRAIANALDIKDSDITWSDEKKMAIIMR
jgi:hypothetical protein